MPRMFADICRENGAEVEVAMLAHGGRGWNFLRSFVPEAKGSNSIDHPETDAEKSLNAMGRGGCNHAVYSKISIANGGNSVGRRRGRTDRVMV